MSTEDQSKDGVSLAHQIAKIRTYAELKDSEIVEIVEDDGISAKTSIAQVYSMSWNWPGLDTFSLHSWQLWPKWSTEYGFQRDGDSSRDFVPAIDKKNFHPSLPPQCQSFSIIGQYNTVPLTEERHSSFENRRTFLYWIEGTDKIEYTLKGL